MDSASTESSVSLWTTDIPHLGLIAEHHWLVVDDQGVLSRWEVWQDANVIGCVGPVSYSPDYQGESWDHLHKNLMSPEQGVRNGPAYKLHEWSGDVAAYLIERIKSSPQTYPWRSQYRYWPGPNSNTYVQWILLGKYQLSRKGLGKQYCRLAPGVSAFKRLA